MKHLVTATVLLFSLALLSACDDGKSSRDARPEPPHPLLGNADELRHDAASGASLDSPARKAFGALGDALDQATDLLTLVVAQPEDGEALLGDDQPPRFLWRDPADAADTWWVGIGHEGETSGTIRLLVRGAMPLEAALDPLSMSLHAWTPSPSVWSEISDHAAGAPVVVTIVGFAADAPGAPLSRGAVTITPSAGR